TRHQQ
ncbi:hypothetical protein D039_4388B, partial [Vibrio parahaemolyticus EKP-028]